ncbi:hypothetical protein JIN77_16835 [Verrucomicrobiaceae bacterium R5-34]|uniref:Uncharacterized protein n=1 Tax=Oceaniferula flava TaxID=2800421 RepID=A0AAE2SGR5_9BACT|nr:hypothetical protein [Oceaniferula flavus]MBK1832402.1 hypothetical protein [Verrucomicrobiaceae bacterium R5-34]MBK1856592.1 hypothetical protein [Oceaniferula flavus]MBM1137900.1 hypothetical protein [Oceaniferula flavus]
MTIRLQYFTFGLLACAAHANELPPEFHPYKSQLGTWEGNGVLTITNNKDTQKYKYTKSSSVRYNKNINAIVVVQSLKNPFNSNIVTVSSIIRWDRVSKLYKGLASSEAGDTRVFSISYKSNVFNYTQLDLEDGHDFKCVIKVADDSNYEESGESSTPSGIIKWRLKYSRSDQK